jgi:hypothetical protein
VKRGEASVNPSAFAGFELVRDRIGPVASLHRALIVAGLPKTRSGKILRGKMRRIADGEDRATPATIEDRPARAASDPARGFPSEGRACITRILTGAIA